MFGEMTVFEGGGSGAAQGGLGGVRRGVQVAGLEGHVSRSAVYLIHKVWAKGLGRRRGENRELRRASIAKKEGCYHTRSVNVL